MGSEYRLIDALGKAYALELMSLLASSAGMNYTELVGMSGFNGATVAKRLRELGSSGLVDKETFENRTTLYTISRLGLDVYMNRALPALRMLDRRSRGPRP